MTHGLGTPRWASPRSPSCPAGQTGGGLCVGAPLSPASVLSSEAECGPAASEGKARCRRSSSPGASQQEPCGTQGEGHSLYYFHLGRPMVAGPVSFCIRPGPCKGYLAASRGSHAKDRQSDETSAARDVGDTRCELLCPCGCWPGGHHSTDQAGD